MRGKRFFFIFSLISLLIGCRGHDLSSIKYPDSYELESIPHEEKGPTRIVINVPARQLTLYQGSKAVHQFPVAVGQPVFKTPVGPRFMREIIWNPWWLPPNSPWAHGSSPTPPGPNNPLGLVKMDLGGAILLHGTNKEVTVGTPASHGCMRMFNKDAKTLAWWIQNRHTSQTDSNLPEKYAQNRGQSFHVWVDNPVPVEIRYDLFAMDTGQFFSHPDIYSKEGNRKRRALDILEAMGYNMDLIDEFALTRLLDNSRSKTAFMSIKELAPGKLSASKNRIPDPVDQAWKDKQASKSRRARIS